MEEGLDQNPGGAGGERSRPVRVVGQENDAQSPTLGQAFCQCGAAALARRDMIDIDHRSIQEMKRRPGLRRRRCTIGADHAIAGVGQPFEKRIGHVRIRSLRAAPSLSVQGSAIIPPFPFRVSFDGSEAPRRRPGHCKVPRVGETPSWPGEPDRAAGVAANPGAPAAAR